MTFDEVTYKIVGFDSELGRVEVLFTGLDFVTNIELHLTPAGLYPEGDKLDTYIRMMCPIHLINRKEKIAAGVPNKDAILSLVESLPESSQSTITQPDGPKPAPF